MATMTEPESGKLQLDCEEEEAVDFALLRNPSELAGARYVPAVFSPSEHADLFEQARSIEFSAVNRGITRGPGAPRVHAFTRARRSCREKFSEEGWPLFVQRIIDRLRHVGILQASSNEPDQVSVNHYASSDYNMVPHRDGYVMQAVVVSLGSSSVLEFWPHPRTQDDIDIVPFLKRSSGTEVAPDKLMLPPTHRFWLQPGSALVSRGHSLFDFVHGLRRQDADEFRQAELVNGAQVLKSCADLQTSCMLSVGACSTSDSSCEDERERRMAMHHATSVREGLKVARSERISIVLWNSGIDGFLNTPLLPNPLPLNTQIADPSHQRASTSCAPSLERADN